VLGTRRGRALNRGRYVSWLTRFSVDAFFMRRVFGIEVTHAHDGDAIRL
jgi:hypothetical protein